MTATEMLKAAEAAVVARVSLRDVNRVIDERILPETLVSIDNGRYVQAAACALISFYFESAKHLTSEERLFAIRYVEPSLRSWTRAATKVLLKADWIVRDEYLTIDLRPFFERSIKRLERLDVAREMVSVSDDVMGGSPVIKGTRILVHDVAAAMAAGVPVDEILEDYPSLTAEKLELVALYADANPLRGRPKPLMARLPKGTGVISEHRVPRRRA
ncbi:DUF433 domain-containing protein [Mesorhizobium sp. 1B3]|uniref:DUF433 domain-containing protein n=1 Tax=Mesorhizobium sp. 1B3 TaxID=3243599 RepID=UPI003D976586